MADESNNGSNTDGQNGTAQPAVTQEQPTDQPRVYTQEEVEAIRKETHDSAFAAARRVLKTDKPQPQQKAKPNESRSKDESVSTPDIAAEIRSLRQENALNAFFADHAVPKDDRGHMKLLIEDADPSDPTAWVESRLRPLLKTPKAESANGNTQPVNNNAASTMAAAQAATAEQNSLAPPQSNAGAPQSLPVWERPSDPFKWTGEDIARLEAQKGVREARKIIRRKAEEAAARMTFKLPGRGRPT